MTDITNEQRAERARVALEHYVTATREEVFENSSSEIADLIADLLHLTVRLDEGDDPVESTLRLARLHYEAESADECGNQFGLRCPHCGRSDEIDIAATVWVRLCPDGTDVTAAANGDHDWEQGSSAKCCACGYHATVAEFRVKP
ncbi:MAG: hypothetical protein ACRD9W_13765 [Terriglobia bacterium]